MRHVRLFLKIPKRYQTVDRNFTLHVRREGAGIFERRNALKTPAHPSDVRTVSSGELDVHLKMPALVMLPLGNSEQGAYTH